MRSWHRPTPSLALRRTPGDRCPGRDPVLNPRPGKETPPPSEAARGRSGRGLLLVLLLAAVASIVVLGLRAGARASGFGEIDPAGLTLGELPSWADARWTEEFERVLGAYAPFSAEDERALDELRQLVASFPFVEAVGPPRVHWPDGLELDIAVRRPVASLPLEDGFLLVAADGTILTGFWPLPPRIDGVTLPILGPLSDVETVFRWAEPGDWLVEEAHTDALDVAVSLAQHLSRDERRELGALVIDASRGRQTSVEEPGVRLELEDERLILFGRPPYFDAPGELPVAAKWAAVRRAQALGEGWRLVDVRWDRPEIVLATPPLLEAPETAAAEGTNPRSPARRASAPVDLVDPLDRGLPGDLGLGDTGQGDTRRGRGDERLAGLVR